MTCVLSFPDHLSVVQSSLLVLVLTSIFIYYLSNSNRKWGEFLWVVSCTEEEFLSSFNKNFSSSFMWTLERKVFSIKFSYFQLDIFVFPVGNLKLMCFSPTSFLLLLVFLFLSYVCFWNIRFLYLQFLISINELFS